MVDEFEPLVKNLSLDRLIYRIHIDSAVGIGGAAGREMSTDSLGEILVRSHLCHIIEKILPQERRPRLV